MMCGPIGNGFLRGCARMASCTLLAALWAADPAGAADEVVGQLSRGDLTLTGNFRGQETEIVAEFEVPDVQRV